MNDFRNMFGVKYEDAISNPKSVFVGSSYRITILTERLIRLEYQPEGKFENRPTEFAKFRNFKTPEMEVVQDDSSLNIKTKYFNLFYKKEKTFIGTKVAPDVNFYVKFNNIDRVWYFGQAEARNFMGTSVSLDNARDIPKLSKGLYSTDGFVSIDDSETLIFNEDGSVGKRADKRIDTYLFMYENDFGYCLKDYYDLTCYPPLIPRYALGIWWDRNVEYDANEIYKISNKFKKEEIPFSVMVLNKWSKDGFNFNDNIPSPDNLIDNLKSQGIHFGLKMDLNGLPTDDGKPTQFNVFDKNYVNRYIEKVIKPLCDFGVDFFAINYSGRDLYTLRMANCYFYKYIASLEDRRGLILSRNGLVASHLYPVSNSGETFVSWNTLEMLPLFNSTSSNIGVTWWSHAIGGYKGGIEDTNLFIRYIELATYSPIFRLASEEGHYYKREPWKWDVKTRKIIKDYANLRFRLIPYLYTEGYKYARTGLPIIEPLYYVYPELYDEPTYRNEYFFGSELFVAPITKPKDAVMNRTVLKMFIPNGIWYDFKTGKKFPGGRHLMFYKDEDYPVFAKQGAIIPLSMNDQNNLNYTGIPDSLEIHIFPGKNNTYKLYEDDERCESYKEKRFLNTAIDYNYLPNNYTVIIRPLEGNMSVIPETRRYKIRFRNTRPADDVIVYLGSERLMVKSYADDQDFIVETNPVSTREQLSINCKGKDIEIDAVHIINEDVDDIINDLKIKTELKERIADILFSDLDISKKRIAIIKLKAHGLDQLFSKMFLKLLEYIAEI